MIWYLRFNKKSSFKLKLILSALKAFINNNKTFSYFSQNNVKSELMHKN